MLIYLHVVADLLVLIQVMPNVGSSRLLYHSPPSSNSFSLGLFKLRAFVVRDARDARQIGAVYANR